MTNPAFYIRKITQKNNHTFTIDWNDGRQMDYRLHKLQQKCPCAGCTESRAPNVKEDVRAINIQSVGRYALRIFFTSGCSKGIYDFDFLRHFID